MIEISLCMIVRNEESSLPRCISHEKDKAFTDRNLRILQWVCGMSHTPPGCPILSTRYAMTGWASMRRLIN